MHFDFDVTQPSIMRERHIGRIKREVPSNMR